MFFIAVQKERPAGEIEWYHGIKPFRLYADERASFCVQMQSYCSLVKITVSGDDVVREIILKEE